MKDENDIMVKDILIILKEHGIKKPLNIAIEIMYRVRSYKNKYFVILDKES